MGAEVFNFPFTSRNAIGNPIIWKLVRASLEVKP